MRLLLLAPMSARFKHQNSSLNAAIHVSTLTQTVAWQRILYTLLRPENEECSRPAVGREGVELEER